MAFGLGLGLPFGRGAMGTADVQPPPGAFPNGTTELYLPIAANAGTSQWGKDVRKLSSAVETTADDTTICNLGTGGTVTVQCNPYTTNAAVGGASDTFGWAVNPTDMGSLAVAKRRIPAGNHVHTGQVLPNTAFVAEARDIRFIAYRVSSAAAGRVRTLLGTILTAMPLSGGTITASLALPELTFEEDETIQYSFRMEAGGIATGRTVQFRTGLASTVNTRITTPAWTTV